MANSITDSSNELPPRKLRVLVVDDDKTLANTLGYMVDLLEHAVSIAYDGVSALSIAESFQPDIILLDIGLPDMTGYDVCKKIRANPALKDCMVIALTGWGQEHREHAQASEFDRHIIKPIKLETLEDLLASLDFEAD